MEWVVRVVHDAAGEEGGIDIPLHHARPIPQYMPPLTERPFGAHVGGVITLRQCGRPGMQIDHYAAGTFSLAMHVFDKHAGGSD